MELKGIMKRLNLKFSLNYLCLDLVNCFLSFLYVTIITNQKVIIAKTALHCISEVDFISFAMLTHKRMNRWKLGSVYMVIYAGTNSMQRC